MDSGERLIRVESVRIPKYRDSYGSCLALSRSIEQEGLHRPVTVWSDGTLVSGGRRLFAHMLLKRERIQAVFVNTIEDAAKRMLGDNQDPGRDSSVPWSWTEACRFWEVMRRLDEPAAARRLAEARRRGIELRRATQSGRRKPGRTSGRSEDYALTVLAEPFGISGATARRIEVVYRTSVGLIEASDERRELARVLMRDINNGGSVWASHKRLTGAVHAPHAARPKPVEYEPASADRQLKAWTKSLPQMEGLVAGLVELGPPNPDLTWEEVGPFRTRLMVVRRELEKMIKQMRENSNS